LMFAIPAIAAQYLPWWGTVLVLIGEVIVLVKGVPKLLGYWIKRFALGLFTTKSRVLKGATVQVHEVRPTTRPARRRKLGAAGISEDSQRTEVTAADGTVVTTPVVRDDEEGDDNNDDDESGEESEEEESKNDRFVLVDCTITPVSGSSKMELYEPSELLLVPIDAKIDLTEDPTSNGISASAHDLTLIDTAGAETKDFDKISGPAHLRITFRCPETLKGRVKFRYYFETFGDLALP
jgi:hypothetical protein